VIGESPIRECVVGNDASMSRLLDGDSKRRDNIFSPL